MLVRVNNSKTTPTAVAELSAAVGSVFTFGVVRFLLAALLIVAAYLKSGNLLAVPTSPWPEFGLVMFELVLAAILLSSAPAMVAWWLAVACFTTFAIVAAYKTLLGYESCGCFGAVVTPPWIALLIDLLALTALAATRRSIAGSHLQRSQSVIPAWLPSLRSVGWACVLLVGLKSSWLMATDRDERFIDPSQWLNTRLPLLDSIDIGDKLAQGEWIVVFHRAGCLACEELVEHVKELDSLSNSEPRRPIALIRLVESVHAMSSSASSQSDRAEYLPVLLA